MRFLCLLRGVNVGGRNRLPMARLREIFEGAGADDTASYIKSGNVVFTATRRAAPGIVERVRERLLTELELDVPLLLRDADEVREAARNHPFADRDVEDRHRHIVFLADEPTAARREAFDPPCRGGEEYALIGRELHLCFPEGLARTKLTNDWIDRALGTTSSTRNWRTVAKLLEMLGD